MACAGIHLPGAAFCRAYDFVGQISIGAIGDRLAAGGVGYDDFAFVAQGLEREQARGDGFFFIQGWDDERKLH